MKEKIIEVAVKNKIAAVTTPGAFIVCGNSDYVINFSFDEPWEAYSQKTARFIFNKQHIDRNFTGTTCKVPIISNTRELFIGVYAGELETTTPARVDSLKSVVCDDVAGTETDETLILRGNDGFSPVIEVESESDTEYKLRIITDNGEFTTPNLKGGPGEPGLNKEDFIRKVDIGNNLEIDESGNLNVKTASAVEADNTLPVTSALVAVEVGNINVILETI